MLEKNKLFAMRCENVFKLIGTVLFFLISFSGNALWGQSGNDPNSSLSRPYLYIYYNLKPDSIFINDQLLDSSLIVPNSLTANKLKYYIEAKGEYSIRATSWASNSIEKKVQARSKVTTIKLNFKLKTSIFADYGDTSYKELPLKSLFGKTSFLTKGSMKGFHYLTFSSLLLPIGLSRDKSFKNHYLASLSVGVLQLIHGTYLQTRRWRGKSEQFQPSNILWKNWRVNLNFTSLHYNGREAIDQLREYPQGTLRTNIERIKVNALKDYGITIGVERKLKRDLFISANFTYAPTEINIQFDDTVRYGATNIPYQFFLEESFASLIADLELNYTFLRLLNHEWSVGFGGFWGNSAKLEDEYRIKRYVTIEEYDTTYVSYKFEQGGLSANLSIRTLLNSHLGYHFRLNYVNSVNITIKDEKKKYQNVNIHVGFFYQF